MSRFWSPAVHRLTPYVPGEQPKIERLIKLNTNENPYGPSPRALSAMRTEVSDELRRYPDPDASRLKTAIANAYGLTAAQVFVGNGSDEVLAHVFCALLNHAQPVLFPDVTYSFYPVYCRLYEIAFQTIPLDDAFQIRVADYAPPNGGVIFANPNAPTGRALPLNEVEQIVRANADAVVVVDEAYVDFGAQSAVPLIHRYPNLLVVHTLSKSRSLAGLRVGYALGDATLIEGLTRVKDSFNSYPLDRIALAGAVAAIEDRAHFDETRAKVIASREWLIAELAALGFVVLDSCANFVFARHPAHEAQDLFQCLRAQGVLVRHFKLPRIEQFLRISIGTDEDCAALVAALKSLLA